MFTLNTYYPYEDLVLDVDAAHQIKQVLFGAYQAATLPTVLTGTTTGGSSSTVLIDSGATFVTDSVSAGDVVYNATDGSVAIVKSVDSETQLTCTPLLTGTGNTFDTSDSYAVRAVPHQVVLLTDDSGANLKGFYKRNAGNTEWEAVHAGGGGTTTVELAENLTAGDLVKIINDSGTRKVSGLNTRSVGSSTQATANNATVISACQLDTDKFVICYRDDSDSSKGKAIAATVSGTTITFGSEVEFNSGGNTFIISCAQLGTDKFVVAYRDAAATDGNVAVCTVSGTVITAGAETNFDSTDIGEVSVCKIDTDKFAVLWSHSSSGLRAIVATVSGTTPTFGSAVTISSTNNLNVQDRGIAQLDTDKFICVWFESSNLYAQVCTVSTTTITEGSTEVYVDGGVTWTGVCGLSTDMAYCAFASTKSYGMVIEVDGTDINFNMPHLIGIDTLDSNSRVKQLDEGKICLTSEDDNSFQVGFYREGRMRYYKSGEFDTADVGGHTCPAPLNLENKFVIAYRDSTNSDLDAIVIQEADFDLADGILEDTGTAGQSKIVTVFGGASDANTFAAADVGRKAHIQSDGSVGVGYSPFEIGKIIDTGELIITK